MVALIFVADEGTPAEREWRSTRTKTMEDEFHV
jgi:hypothetical protein